MATEPNPEQPTPEPISGTQSMDEHPAQADGDCSSNLKPEPPTSPARYVVKKPEYIADPVFEKKLNKYIERTEKGIEKLTERQSLSGQEFDKQIVALAGGGLALSVTLVKDFLDNKTDILGVLFASWTCFLLALTANLISHRISTEHYNLMIERQQHYLVCSEEDNDVDEELDEKLGQRINYRTKWVNALNLTALITCLLGIIFFIIFTFYNKYHTNARPGPTTAATTTRLHP
jgi:hypothetical protein